MRQAVDRSHPRADPPRLVRAVIALQADDVVEAHRMPELERLDSFAALERWAELNIERLAHNRCERGCSFGSHAGELTECDERYVRGFATATATATGAATAPRRSA
jgi:hypothetical protein